MTQNHDTYFLHTPGELRAVKKEDCTLFLSVDPAISEAQSADYMVIETWAETPIKDLLLLDVHRGHWSHPEQQDEVEETFDRQGAYRSPASEHTEALHGGVLV